MSNPSNAPNSNLRKRVSEEIQACGGSISFERYMDIVLYESDLGYYTRHATIIGAEGDFTTAPEISPLFAQAIASELQMLFAAGAPRTLYEVGPGTGRLAGQLMHALAAADALPDRLYLFDRSAALAKTQQDHLKQCLEPALFSRVCWIDEWPETVAGVIVANELLDALPAARFYLDNRAAFELRVGENAQGLHWHRSTLPASPQLMERIAHLIDAPQLPHSYQSEYAPLRETWVESLGSRLQVGAVLLVDYGYARAEYYHPQRANGTLRCYQHHQRHDDPFWQPGQQDLSVHVEFTAIAQAAVRAGFRVDGFSSQSQFLLGSGVLETLSVLSPHSIDYARAASALRTLTAPGEMGDAVKVMLLSKGMQDAQLLTLRDMRHSL